MHVYLVKISADINYWWDKEYRIEATSVATAIARAMRQFRAEDRLKRKRIIRFKLEISTLK